MTAKDEPKFAVGRATRSVLGRSCISHVETRFFAKAREVSDSEPEWAKTEAGRILLEVGSRRRQLEQLIRSAHECGTASTAKEARERFNAINNERLEIFLAKKGERIETLLWNGVYAKLLVPESAPDYLASLFEAIRALDLLQIVKSLEGPDQPPSWYDHCDLPISYPLTLRPPLPTREREGLGTDQAAFKACDTIHPVSGIRELETEDLSVIEKTLELMKEG